MNLSDKWDREEERELKSSSFWRNIVENGLYGGHNQETCHHPTFNVYGVTVIKKNDHYLRICVSCGKYTEFDKRGLK